jgi:hypothetical protein
VRVTWAFHAREVRFEREVESAFVPIFPETFSFHPDRHDPFELHLQLEDLWSDPRRLGPGASRRDAQELVRRLVVSLPRYLERVLAAASPGLAGASRARVHGDALVVIRIAERFLLEKQLGDHPDARFTAFHLRKLAWESARVLVETRVPPPVLEAWLEPSPERADGPVEISDRALLGAATSPEPDCALLLRVAERCFDRWLEDVCLETGNGAFESEASPFGSREAEVLAAASAGADRALRRRSQLAPFLRRRGNLDCLRVLRKLEVWLLRQYDVPRASAVIRHAEDLGRGRERRDILSWHSTRNYLLLIAFLIWPFVGAAVAYTRAPLLFDAAAAFQILGVIATVLWYLLYQFMWQKDLAFFHASVPRIGAGIIVGYLPVFLIDEVWDLASRPWFPLGVVVTLLGITTLLYIYVEVNRRIGDPRDAFLLGVVQALALGLVITTLLGPFMAIRTWGHEEMPIAWLRVSVAPFFGELPRIMGIDPIYAFPTAVLLMTFMSFFIGTFLQLLWEDLPITEPL